MEKMVTKVVADSLRKAYNGKKVFLTGHTGFKGSWLLAMLNILGANVKGYALEPENEQSLYSQIEGDNLCQSVIADILDKQKLRNEILQYQPDFIFHMAAQPLVLQSYKTPVETFEVNAIGTANLLDSARSIEKPCSIIVITTDKVYENQEWEHSYKETDRLGGHDAYSASKACTEIIVSSYYKSFFSNDDNNIKGLATARAGNVIGGGDWAVDRIVPDIVRSLEKDQEIIVRNPSAIRPWQHVLEPLTGYLILGANLADKPLVFSEAFNFGPHISDTLKVMELVNIALNIWGKGQSKLLNDTTKVHEAGILKLDNNKAIEKLGWKPVFTSTNALKWTIDWYKNYTKQPVKELTFNQINAYFKLL
ncbi:CDP-glucose 4,6-dehydratase [Mucilaginibacter sp. UYCu711]|uniref:CDP-glucose 4,6-dehydratase n=1 Tax=Mucilaginibacter sp. UYCu711 TaxID=3156339 RepID=UPI003D1B07C5